MTRTILVLAANPTNKPHLRIDKEIREIKIGLGRAQKRNEFAFEQTSATRAEDVRRAMLDYRPNIVHFCGHGAGEEGIIFENDLGEAQVVNTEALVGFFELFANKVECVVLNACYSEIQAEAIAKYIPYVIGMSSAIGDTVAIEFAVAFYDALGAGESVEFAYKLACNSIQWAGIVEELIPILKSNTNYLEQQKITYSSNDFVQQRFCENEDEIFSITFSDDKSWLAAGSDKTVFLWDVHDGEYGFREEATAAFPHSDYVYAVAFSPNSKFLATAGQDKIVRVWRVETNKLLWEQNEKGSRNHNDAIYSVVFSPDGKNVLSGSYDGSVKIWDAFTGNFVKECHVSGRVSCIAHAPKGREAIVAIGSHDNSVTLWNPNTGHRETLMDNGSHQSSVEAVVFSPNGLWLASSGLDKAVILWDVEKKHIVWRREGNQYHQYLVKSIAISPDGETLASASWDKKINLWDIKGNHYQELPYSASPWHEDWIWSVAFSSDGKILASGGSDGCVMIWRRKPSL